MTKQEALQKIEELKKFIENEEKKPAPEERFWEILKGCVVETSEKYPGATFLLKDGKYFFELQKDILWCSYGNVWSVFEREFNMTYNEIQNLIKIQLEEHFKCNGVTAKKSCGGSCHLIEEHFKCKVTPTGRF